MYPNLCFLLPSNKHFTVAHVRTGGGSTFDQTHIHYVAGIPTGGPTKFNAHHPRCLSADVTLVFQRISRTFPLGVAAAL